MDMQLFCSRMPKAVYRHLQFLRNCCLECKEIKTKKNKIKKCRGLSTYVPDNHSTKLIMILVLINCKSKHKNMEKIHSELNMNKINLVQSELTVNIWGIYNHSVQYLPLLIEKFFEFCFSNNCYAC